MKPPPIVASTVRRPRPLLLLALAALAAPSPLHAAPPGGFTAVVLGSGGGLDESDLTSLLVAPLGRPERVALDAGSIYSGLSRAAARGAFGKPASPGGAPVPAGALLQEGIKAYLISHPHLDHVAGLAMVAPDDSRKAILGLATTVEALRAHLFSGALWPNFTDEGAGAIGRYHLVRLAPGARTPVPDTPLFVEAFPLSHSALTSTAFLLEAGDAYLLYLGDTGPDAVEGQGRLAALWARVAPLLRAGSLRALVLECSYPDPRPDGLLFGHLTPRWIGRELDALAALVKPAAPAEALRGLTLVVTHIKPALGRGPDPRARITEQLAALKPRLKALRVAAQGDRFDL